MKSKFFRSLKFPQFDVVLTAVLILLVGVLTSSGQTGDYLYTGQLTTVSLAPGLYDITAYGAQGGSAFTATGGLGAEMEGEFYFSSSTSLTLRVGGSGTFNGGGGGSFISSGNTALVVAGGGGGAGLEGGNGGAGSIGTAGSSGTGSFGAGSGGEGGQGGYGGNGGAFGFIGGGGGGAGYLPTSGGGNGNPGGNGEAGGQGGSAFNPGFPLSGRGGYEGGGYGGGGGGGIDNPPGPGYYGGGGGGGGGYSGGGGGYGGDGSNDGSSGGGGGGGSIIDSSALADLVEISGTASPDGSPNGEIIITAVPEQPAGILNLAVLAPLVCHFLRRRR